MRTFVAIDALSHLTVNDRYFHPVGGVNPPSSVVLVGVDPVGLSKITFTIPDELKKTLVYL